MSEFNFELDDNYARIYKRQAGLGLEIPEQVEVIMPLFCVSSTLGGVLQHDGIMHRNAAISGNDNGSRFRPEASFAYMQNNLVNSVYRSVIEELKTVGMKDIMVSPVFMEMPSLLAHVGYDRTRQTVRSTVQFNDFISARMTNTQLTPVEALVKAQHTPEDDLKAKTVTQSFLASSLREFENSMPKRRLYKFGINSAVQNEMESNIKFENNRLIIAIGEDENFFPFDFIAGENCVFIWATPWRMKAPVTGKIPVGVNVREYLLRILPMLVSEENDYRNFTFTKNNLDEKVTSTLDAFGGTNREMKLWVSKLTAKVPVTLKSFFNDKENFVAVNYCFSNESYRKDIAEILKPLEEVLTTIDLVERVSNMLVVASAIDLYSRKDNGGKVVFSSLISQNALADVIEQMYEHMDPENLPKKFTANMMQLGRINNAINVIGAGGIGSVFAEFFVNYEFETLTNVMTSLIRNTRNRYRLALTDMDDIEIHNLNRSSIFAFADVQHKRMKTEALSTFLAADHANSTFSTNPVIKTLSGPYFDKSREELHTLFASGTGRCSKTQIAKGLVIDCRDVLNSDYTIEKTALKLSYNGDKRLGFHFNLDRFVDTIFVLPGSNYDVVPSFCVPPKFCVALGLLFANVPFIEKYAAQYAELNVETLINNASETIL